MGLLDPIQLGGCLAHNRVLFGPIVTNLGTDDRTFSTGHTAFYERRAQGGCATIVLEEASVHDGDWPYERSPLAARCEQSWREVGRAVHKHGSLAVAAIGHTGGQGSSAYSQRELWAPSRVPEVNSREVPKWMEPDDIAAVIDGFATATATAMRAGLDGVEVNAGQHSLVRQFMSGLTNHRRDEWGDRSMFARTALQRVRATLGHGVLGLRLSCDELAPWAGITPETAIGFATSLGALVDYLVVVRGSIYSVEATRPDFHSPAGFNIELCRAVRAAVNVPVVLQGSVVDPGQAEWAIADGICDAVEMTRAQLADADLVQRVRDGGAPRPCIRCNQTCQVRDVRNPIISCVVDPVTGYETAEPILGAPSPRDVLIVGAGPAGLETARLAARRGHRVTVAERSDRVGGVAAKAGPGGPIIDWLEGECRRLGVVIELGREVCDPTGCVVVCIGSVPGVHTYAVAGPVLDVLDPLPEVGVIAIWDPIGGPIAVAIAETLGVRAVLITPDQIAGNELSRTGDLAPANTRLQQRGVRIVRRSVMRVVRVGEVEVEDRYTGARSVIAADAFVDAGFRLPDESMPGFLRVGDCVAPRTIYEAMLEARRVALSL